MAIFNTAKLLDVIVRGRIAEQAPAAELVNELEDQMEKVLSDYPKHDRMELMEQRLLLAITELKKHQAEVEARQARQINQATGIILAGIAIAVGLIIAFA